MHRTFTQAASRQKNEQDGYEKGQRFEQFIIKLFNDHFFYLKKWRKSKKFTDSSISIDHWNPDIEMELVFTSVRKYRFAVECKWQKRFKDGKINWATDAQICSYRMFQDRVRIPVFVAIGIGGEPDNPEELFLTPLNCIYMYNEIYKKDLIPFKRKPTHKFYYDVKQLKLF
jgi:hypothetical protein